MKKFFFILIKYKYIDNKKELIIHLNYDLKLKFYFIKIKFNDYNNISININKNNYL